MDPGRMKSCVLSGRQLLGTRSRCHIEDARKMLSHRSTHLETISHQIILFSFEISRSTNRASAVRCDLGECLVKFRPPDPGFPKRHPTRTYWRVDCACL